MNKDYSVPIANMFIFLIFIIITTVLAVFKGFVVSKIWNWFLVPHGIFSLDIPTGIAICLLFNFVCEYKNSRNASEIVNIALEGFINFTIVLICAYILKLFI